MHRRKQMILKLRDKRHIIMASSIHNDNKQSVKSKVVISYKNLQWC